MALVPTTSNPTIYGLHVYQMCTFSVPFRRKTRPNRPVEGEPVFARANPQVGRRRPVKPSQNGPESLPQKSRLFLAPRAKDWENCLPNAQQSKEGRFPPQETAFYAESAETFEGRNDLAANRLQSSDVTGPSRHLVRRPSRGTREQTLHSPFPATQVFRRKAKSKRKGAWISQRRT